MLYDVYIRRVYFSNPFLFSLGLVLFSSCLLLGFSSWWRLWLFGLAVTADDHAGGALDAADGAVFDANDQAAGVDDAFADLAVDRNDADVTISLLIIISNIIIKAKETNEQKQT